MNENEAVQKPVEPVAQPAVTQPVVTQPTVMQAPKSNKKMLIMVAILVVVGVLVIGGLVMYILNSTPKSTAVTANPATKQIVIGFSMGTLQEERWQKDRDSIIAQAKVLGISVDVQGANNDKDKQISQAESMIAKGVNVLLIAPYDATSMVGVISDAHKVGIKVISYDRLMTKSNADYYISFDNEKVGQLQAQSVVDAVKDQLGKGKVLKFAYIGGSPTDNNATLLRKGSFEVLQPLIDKGEIKIVVDKPTADWDPDVAYQNMKSYLSTSSGAIDVVVAANDGTAGGAVKALQEYHLAGKVPVSGQDAELAALQRIVAGTQTATVYKPIPREDAAVLDMAIKLANNQKIEANAKVNDGQIDVPSVLLEPTLVTKDNILSTVIKDNYHTSAEIYQK